MTCRSFEKATLAQSAFVDQLVKVSQLASATLPTIERTGYHEHIAMFDVDIDWTRLSSLRLISS
jgi:hypothetical protein